MAEIKRDMRIVDDKDCTANPEIVTTQVVKASPTTKKSSPPRPKSVKKTSTVETVEKPPLL